MDLEVNESHGHVSYETLNSRIGWCFMKEQSAEYMSTLESLT